MSAIEQRQPRMPKLMEYPESQDVPLRTSRVKSAYDLPIQQPIHDIRSDISFDAPSTGPQEALERRAVTNKPGAKHAFVSNTPQYQ
jgi:hypothetical protein